MCNVSDKIKFCTCATDSPEKLRHYWILHRYNKNKEAFVIGLPYFPDETLYLFDNEFNKIKLAKRLNEQDAFDVSLNFKPNDRLQIVLNNHLFPEGQYVAYCFSFSKGRWKTDEYDAFELMNFYDEVRFGKFKHLKASTG